ncbi:unnamed protein product [Closterium sp. NIES-54]
MEKILGLLQVDQSTVAMVEHFGRFVKALDPGCHCVPWCCCYRPAGLMSLRVRQLDVRCETKTKTKAPGRVFFPSNSLNGAIANDPRFL